MESHGQNRFERLPSSSAARRSLKRKLDVDFEDDHHNNNKNDPFSITTGDAQHDLIREVRAQVDVLESCFSASDADRAACKHAIQVVSELAKNEDIVNVIVDCGAVPALVRHLQSPPIGEGDIGTVAYEHEVEKGSAFTLGLLAVKPEHQHLIVDAGALPYLVDLLKRHKNGQNSRAVNGVIRRAADAITNLAHENSNIKSRVRVEGGLPPLVELLEFIDTKVQRAAAGALRTLAFKNDENKNQIVECNALPTLILMLRSEDAAIHYEAVGVIGNLVHSSPNIKKEVLLAGALQPVIRLLSSCCSESQREAALLLGQFAATDSDCKVHIVQRGAVGPLIDMLQSPDPQLREMSAFALGRLAQDTHNQAGIAHSGGLAPLLKLLDSKNGSLQHNSAFALYGLADNEDNVADLIKVGGVQKLQDGEFIVQPTRDVVAKTLKRLEEKIHGRVLSHLLYLIRTGDNTVQRRIALALAHLCSPDDQRIIFIDSNVMPLPERVDHAAREAAADKAKQRRVEELKRHGDVAFPIVGVGDALTVGAGGSAADAAAGDAGNITDTEPLSQVPHEVVATEKASKAPKRKQPSDADKAAKKRGKTVVSSGGQTASTGSVPEQPVNLDEEVVIPTEARHGAAEIFAAGSGTMTISGGDNLNIGGSSTGASPGNIKVLKHCDPAYLANPSAPGWGKNIQESLSAGSPLPNFVRRGLHGENQIAVGHGLVNRIADSVEYPERLDTEAIAESTLSEFGFAAHAISTFLRATLAGARQGNAREAQLTAEVASVKEQLAAKNEAFQKTLNDLGEQLEKAKELAKEREEAMSKLQTETKTSLTESAKLVTGMKTDLQKAVDERDQVVKERDQFAELLKTSEDKLAKTAQELKEAREKIAADAVGFNARVAEAVEVQKQSAEYHALAKE